jgi:hypothetical protein
LENRRAGEQQGLFTTLFHPKRPAGSDFPIPFMGTNLRDDEFKLCALRNGLISLIRSE